MIYLDHAAATVLDADVLSHMTEWMTEKFYNPSSLYMASRETKRALEESRHTIAQILGAKPSEITFTSGGTEANNLAIHGLLQSKLGANLIVSSIEHESILAPAEKYERRIVEVLPNGRIDLNRLEALIDRQTALISIIYANNEIGTVQDMKAISALIKQKEHEFGTKIVFHTDAAQAGNYCDLHVDRLGVDLMTLNSGKVYGPRGAACLYVRSGTLLEPLLQGGGQESGKRSGTENVANAVGFAEALSKSQAMKESEIKRLTEIKHTFIRQIESSIDEVIVNSPRNHCLPNMINMTFPGIDGEALVMEMDQRGIQLATGSACNASNDLPSHVLLAIGRSNAEAASSIRISMGKGTTAADMDQVLAELGKAIEKLRQLQYTPS